MADGPSGAPADARGIRGRPGGATSGPRIGATFDARRAGRKQPAGRHDAPPLILILAARARRDDFNEVDCGGPVLGNEDGPLARLGDAPGAGASSPWPIL